MKRLSLTALASILAATAQAQTPPYQTLVGPDLIGWDVAFVGDANGDGLDDFLVGSPDDGSTGAHVGAAFLVSGADASFLQSFHGASSYGRFGDSVGAPGDVDLDGFADVVVGGPSEGGTGTVTVYSGQSGALLYQWFGDSPGDGFGCSVAGAGDVNADGVPDVVAGALNDDDFGEDCGMMRVFSGADGSILHTWYGRTADERLGASVAGFADLDGDGHADVLGASSPVDMSGIFGRAVVFSGKTGQLLRMVQSDDLDDGYGGDLASLGDVDADGTIDFGVTSPVKVTRARIYSGKDGSIIYKHLTATLAYGISAAGDRNGDGYADYALGDYDGVQIFSGFDRSLLHEFTLPGKFEFPYPGAVSAYGDVNGDGKQDLVAGVHDGFSATDLVYTLLGGVGEVDHYCAAGISSSGCSATLDATGEASASLPFGFSVQAVGVEGQQNGLFYFGTNGRQAVPWGNGTSYQCVAPPVERAGLLSGSGTNGQCDGTFLQDLNVHWTAQPAHNPGAGVVVQAQLWYRDPLNTSNQTTSLSDAIEFLVGP